MTNKELKEILEKHRKWLNDKESGEIADFKDADLSYADLIHTNLTLADLRSKDLTHADLIYSDLVYTNLNSTDLSYADLMHADLRNADLANANLENADLCNANLIATNLKDANLTNAKLTGVISNNCRNKRIIAVQVNTSRENNLISYWYDLGIVTTGCFQGTLDELKERVEITHEDNDTLRNRYHRAIQFIEDTIKDYDQELERIEK